MELHCLKVNRSIVGRWFPFDRMYFVKFADRLSIKRMFSFAIVMPVTSDTLKLLRELEVDQRIERGHTRQQTKKPVIDKPRLKLFEHVDLEKERWMAVIPLLPGKAKEGDTQHPRYLTSGIWRYAENRMLMKPGMSTKKRLRTLSSSSLNKEENGPSTAFNNQAYLQTPEKDIRPPCMFCPRMILQQAGECHLGDVVCYTSLPLGIRQALSRDPVEDDNDNDNDHETEVSNGQL